MPTSIGLLVDSQNLKGWEWRTIEYLLDNTEEVEINLIIINSSSKETQIIPPVLTEYPGFAFLLVAGRIKDFLVGVPWYRKKRNINQFSWGENTHKLYCEPEEGDGFGNYLPPEVIERLKTTDVAIRFGFGILIGDALTTPTYGVLSFHHGDLRRYRGRPAGFYEFLNREESAAVTLQVLNEKLDAGNVVSIEEVDISDADSWPDVKNRLYKTSNRMLPSGISSLKKSNHAEISKESLGELYTNPNFTQVIQYCYLRFVITLLSRFR